jgi:hypothetical protein
MPDTDTRATWGQLSRATQGLAALSAEIDARAGCTTGLGEDDLEHFHGLCAAMAGLAQALKIQVVALADEALGIPP